MNTPYDFLVVGAGFAGSVLAERLASVGQRVLVIDRRPHVGGNAHDHYNAYGVLVHDYGPHIFHTNAPRVANYLSQFTSWRPYEHRVRSSVDGTLLPFPINLDTVNHRYGLNMTSEELAEYFSAVAEPRSRIETSEDAVVSKIGRDLYETFIRGYTRKQWGLDPSELDAHVAARVSARTSRDDRYFVDSFQMMPLEGYTPMFARMLDHPHIDVVLDTDFHDVQSSARYQEIIYTGAIDEFFEYRYGPLPYRSLYFEFVTYESALRQPVAQINYPNDHAYTRTTEFRHITGQAHHCTTIAYEYPADVGPPYYPVPRPANNALYRRYRELADQLPDVHFVGRLATYKYLNMDQVVAQALALFRDLMDRTRTRNPYTGSLYPTEANWAAATRIDATTSTT